MAARRAGAGVGAVRLGAGVVLLDEPTAQLDVRGEAEIFERILAATRHATTILISHRFSTVRHADRICVLEHGRVVELGTHDELMALGGRYRTMFELQASRFGEREEEAGDEGVPLDAAEPKGMARCRPALSVDVAALQAGSPSRAAAAAGLLRAVAAGGAAGCAAGAVDEAAGGWRAAHEPASCDWRRRADSAFRRPRPGFSKVISDRTQRRFRDRVAIALESHVARLQASVATIAHHERPEYLDRLAMLRDQVFVLDHMYMSLFSTCGWILRLGVTVALLMSIHPVLALLAVFALADGVHLHLAARRGARAEERGAQANRLARHLFNIATTAPPGKEVRVTRIGEQLVTERREAWERWYGPVAARAVGHGAVAHAGVGDLRRAYVGAVVFVSSRARRDGRTGAAGAGRGRAALGVHRRDGRRDRIPARLLAGRLAAHGLAGGLRGVRGRVGGSAGSRGVAPRGAIRRRVVRVPGHVARCAGRCVG